MIKKYISQRRESSRRPDKRDKEKWSAKKTEREFDMEEMFTLMGAELNHCKKEDPIFCCGG